MPDVLIVDPGRFRQQLVWQRSSPIVGHHQSGDPTFTAVAILWAEVTPLRGTELLAARQIKAATWYRVRVRAGDVPGLLATDRFQWNGITLNIESMFPVDGRQTYVECQCVQMLPSSSP